MEPIQRTLILLKGDAIEGGLVGVILARFERAGLRIENCRFVRPDVALLEQHYADLKARHPKAFERTSRYLRGRQLIAMILAGQNAIQKARSLVGVTDPLVASPGTIRGDYGSDSLALADQQDRATLNLVHAADSEAAAERERAMWFPDAEESTP